MTGTNNNFRVKNGLEVTTSATVASLKFSGDGVLITSRADLAGPQGVQGDVGPQGPSGASVPQAWRDYRQALRDIPAQSGFPFNVVWPSVPT